METNFLREYLDGIHRRYSRGYLDSDPVGLVRALAPVEREVGALLAASLALGRVATIRERVQELYRRMDGVPASFLVGAGRREIIRAVKGFKHRFFGESELGALLCNIQRIVREHGNMEGACPAEGLLSERLERFAAELSRPVRGFPVAAKIPLIPSPAQGSTSKRTLMFLRWMVRADDGIDLGLWKSISPSELVVPLDTHVFRVSQLIGLTERKTPSWCAAEEITERLRRFDKDDPVKYDFALSRVGIVEGCCGRFVADVCGGCPLKPACRAAAIGNLE